MSDLDEVHQLAKDIEVLEYDIFRSPAGIYWRSPAAFVEDCIEFPAGESPTAYQLEAVERVYTEKRLALRGPHSIGKTAPASWLILWFALTRNGRDWKNPTTASVWRQLKEFLWPEVHKWARQLRWERIGRPAFRDGIELQDMALRLSTGSAFAVASNKPSAIEGVHADHVLYVYDEAKAIPADTWDASEGAFAGAGEDTGREAFAVAFSTPGEPEGRFYAINSRVRGYEDWHVRVVTKDEAIDAGRMSKQWADQRAKQWGEQSQMYQQRVEGNFFHDEDSVIPLSWVEAANERWLELQDSGTLPTVGSATCHGVDVGDTGPDETVLAPRYGNVIMPLEAHPRADPMKTTGYVTSATESRGGKAVVDVIGVGSGVVSRLRELEVDVLAFNAGEGAKDSTGRDFTDSSGELKFANLRAAAWWGLRERLDPETGDDIALPPDDMLVRDLTTPKWAMTSRGRVLIESKEDIAARLDGRSTDRGDAVVEAFALELVERMNAPTSKIKKARVGLGRPRS